MSEARHVYEQRERAESFGAIAAQYDRFRPTYPDALFAEIAGRGRDVLDVGCGTGKAALPMTARGLHVLGVEIDAAMAEMARANGLDVEVASFEQWDDAGRHFDVLTAGQAWHWVDPVAGAAKAVRVLRPGGSIALFWNVSNFTPDVDEHLRAVYAQHAPQLAEQQHGGVRGRVDLYGAPLTDGGFVELEQREYPWSHDYSAHEFTAMISTHSDVHLLADDTRAALLDGVAGTIDAELGGSITVAYETHTLFARTAG